MIEHFGRAAYGFFAFGTVALIALHLVRRRLHRYHPDIFEKLGRPDFFDSNLAPKYWAFQGFVWRGWMAMKDKDHVLNGLCVLACLGQIGFVIFFWIWA